MQSAGNPRVKAVAALKEKKFREKYGLFVVEGKKMVSEALAIGADIAEIYAVEKFRGVFPEEKTVFVSDEVFMKISGEISPEGVLATVKIPKNTPAKATGTCVFLDGVRDPGNFGTILRTCAACGVKTVYAADCCDAYNPKVIRATMSGIFRVTVYEGAREELLPLLKTVPVIVADMAGENVFHKKVKEPFCIAVGNEANGVSEAVKNAASVTLSLPMEEGVESLNAAVSLSVMLYTLKNQE